MKSIKFQWPVIRKQAAPTEQKSQALGLSDSLGRFMIFGSQGAATPTAALNLYRQSTAVSIPVNMIADAFASIQPVIKKGTETITDHEVLDLLNTPSPFFTRTLMFEILAKDYLVTGENEVVALGSVNSPPLELQPISPGNVSVNEGRGGLNGSFIVSGNTLAGQYTLDMNGMRARYFDGKLRELKQIRNYSSRNNSLLRGQSLLVAASQEVRQHILGNTHNVSLLEKGGRVSLVFSFEEDLNQDDFDATRDRIREQYGGAQAAGEIGIISGGKMDIKELGISNKDMDFADLQNMAKQACALQYKVPLPLITVTANTFNNYKEAKLALYDDAVLPLADRVFGGLTNLLMPRYKLDPSEYRITYDMDQITALAIRRNEELKLRKDLNLETTNEMRESIGREEVDGGDVVLIPANLIPIGSDLFTPEEPGTDLLRDEQEET